MKICVCSDSHGNWYGLQQMVERERPDTVFFLGDGERDWRQVDLPYQTAFAAVCGNCDLMAMEPTFRKMELHGKKIFMTHGHLYSVKQGIYSLMRQAAEFGADIVLYGHTHRAKMEEENGCLYLCPGSMGASEERYLILTIQTDGATDISFRKLQCE